MEFVRRRIAQTAQTRGDEVHERLQQIQGPFKYHLECYNVCYKVPAVTKYVQKWAAVTFGPCDTTILKEGQVALGH